MKVIIRLLDGKNQPIGWVMRCPGCRTSHQIMTEHSELYPGGPIWKFNGNEQSPTFEPSVRVSWNQWSDGKETPHVCHFTVTSGKLNFCGDSTHAMANTTQNMLSAEE